MGKSYKQKRKVIAHSRESLELIKRREPMYKVLDRVGYREEKHYSDCVSFLAW